MFSRIDFGDTFVHIVPGNYLFVKSECLISFDPIPQLLLDNIKLAKKYVRKI